MTTPCAISTLGEVCEWITQGPNPKYDKSGHDDFRVLKTKDLYDDIIHYDSADKISRNVFSQHLRTELKTGDVLIAIVGQGSINKCNVFEARVGTRFIFTRALGLLRPNKRYLDPYFLKYFLQSSAGKELIDSGIAGTSGQQIVTTTHLKSLQIPVPPLPEQQRIVGILDEAFDGLTTATANAEQNLRNARALFESHLEAVFTQRGKGWEAKTLGTATAGVFTGPFGSLLHKSDYVEGGIPLVNPAHITETGIEPDLRKTVSEETVKRLRSYILSQGDIVIGRRGEMGRCALVTETEDGWLCGTGSFFIKPSDRCDPSYLVRFLRSEGCKQRLEKLAGGAVMPNLSNTALADLRIELPSLEQQKAIVNEIDSLAAETQRLESIYQQKLAALDELKKSLLHQAFSGGL